MKTKTLQQHLKEIAQKGGRTTLKRHGRQHFRKMINRRWKKVKANGTGPVKV